MKRSGLLRLLCFAALFPLTATPAFAAENKKTANPKVRLAMGSLPGNIVYLQIDLARALGYFEQEGLDLDIRYFDGGTLAEKALASKEYGFSGNSIDHAVKLREAGQQVYMVASFTDLPCVTVVVRKDLRSQIHSLKDLKGRRIGVTALGAGTHVLAASVLRSAGYSLQDVQIVPVGFGDSLISAIAEKRIDAAVATDPTTTRLLLARQVSILLDLTNQDETHSIFNGPYQFTGLLTRADVIRDHPGQVQAMVNAIVKSNAYIRGHSAVEIAAHLPSGLVGDRYIYIKSLEHSRPSFSRDGMITAAAVASNLQSQITFGLLSPAAPPAPGLFLADQFVRKALDTIK